MPHRSWHTLPFPEIFKLSKPVIAGLLCSLLVFWGMDSVARADAPVTLSICQIQGGGLSSPYTGAMVVAQGVVFADLDETSRRGFFMQSEACDGDPATSDGIFVYLGESGDVVAPGDLVEVSGVVWEYFGLTEIVAYPADVILLSQGNLLPQPVDLNPPFDNAAAKLYFESLEGMRVGMLDGSVVGPTDSDDRTWLVRADLGIQRVFHEDLAGTGEIICVDDNGLYEIAPETMVGDLVGGLDGALGYRMGSYCMELTAAPVVTPSEVTPLTEHSEIMPAILPPEPPAEFSFRLATFNLANLFDNIDDPLTGDTVISGAEYQRRLTKRALAISQALGEPELLAVQEAENLEVLQALAAQPEIQANYGIVWSDSPDSRGLDIALLYHMERVRVLEYQARQGCTLLVDGLGPDGNGLVDDPQNAITCDSDNDGQLDGNRLFSRPPLVVHMQVCREECQEEELAQPAAESDVVELWLVVNHWKSRVQDADTVLYTLPRRIEQAQFVAGLASEIEPLIMEGEANLVILGDLNEHPDGEPLGILEGQGLINLVRGVARSQRYTYIYQGVSQVLDHILLRKQSWLSYFSLVPVHINADYPYSWMGDASAFYRSSDHDPLLVELVVLSYRSYLPMILMNP